MTDFKDLFSCELYKTNRKRTLLKLGIALVVIILLMTLISAVLKNVLGDYINNIGGEFGSSQESIAELESQIQYFEQNQTWINKLLPDNTLYELKARLTAYKYLNENGLAPSSVTYYSAGSFMDFNFYGFTEMCMSAVMTVITIFIIVACVRATSGEYASGALKMQFIRPINKNKFFTAKWLSVFVIAEAYLIASFILSFIIGVIVYGANCPNVLLISGASKAFLTSAFGALVLGMFFKSVMLFMIVQASMFIGAFCKSANKALVLGLVFIAFEIGSLVEEVLALGYIGYLGFLANINWMSALSLAGPAFKGMSLGTMIPITLAWGAGLMYFAYKRFNKLEV